MVILFLSTGNPGQRAGYSVHGQSGEEDYASRRLLADDSLSVGHEYHCLVPSRQSLAHHLLCLLLDHRLNLR